MKSIVVEASEDYLEDVLDFVQEELEEFDLPSTIWMQFELAIEEIFVNITSYAYNPEVGKAEIRTEIKTDPLAVEIEFLDNGVPFNPLDVEEADTSLDGLLDREGGLGILMVRRCMDDVSYTYEEGKNILKIRKKLEDQE